MAGNLAWFKKVILHCMCGLQDQAKGFFRPKQIDRHHAAPPSPRWAPPWSSVAASPDFVKLSLPSIPSACTRFAWSDTNTAEPSVLGVDRSFSTSQFATATLDGAFSRTLLIQWYIYLAAEAPVSAAIGGTSGRSLAMTPGLHSGSSAEIAAL